MTTEVTEHKTQQLISLAEAMMPYFDGSDIVSIRKGKYISMRACGFGVEDSMDFAGIDLRTLQRYRKSDLFFASCDKEGLSRLRSELRNDILGVEFAKNFRLVLMKDAIVLRKAAKNDPKDPLGADELEYLEKIRPYYTPQAYKQIKEVLVESTTKPTTDVPFEELVLLIQRRSQAGEQVYIDPRPVINAAARIIGGNRHEGNENEKPSALLDVPSEETKRQEES